MASSDLYSLGVVMFEMLAGRPPFVGPTAVSIAMQHASTNPPSLRQFNASVPPPVEQIVMRALEKEPENRFSSAAEMQQALRNCARELYGRRNATLPSSHLQFSPRNFSLSAGENVWGTFEQGQFLPPR
jgi:serine/threonine-protein kinase